MPARLAISMARSTRFSGEKSAQEGEVIAGFRMEIQEVSRETVIDISYPIHRRQRLTLSQGNRDQWGIRITPDTPEANPEDPIVRGEW